MTSDPLRAVTLGLCLWPWPGALGLAAEGPGPDEATDYLSPARMSEAQPHWTAEAERGSAAWNGFLLWPAASVGAVFDSNPYHLHRAARAAEGFAVTPRIVAERDTGLHTTIAYAAGDIKLFPTEAAADRILGRAGLIHDWALRPDLIVRLQGEASRRNDPLDNAALVGARREGLVTQTDGLVSASVQKTTPLGFLLLSGTALRSAFDEDWSAERHAAAAQTVGESAFTLKGRAGYRFGPAVYAFAEPVANWRVLDSGAGRSHGVRVVGGVGTDRLAILSGEVFAGWQEQDYASKDARLSTAVVGGRMTWSPHSTWAVSVRADQSLGDVAVGTAADPVGTPTNERTATLQMRYAFSRLWSAEAIAGVRVIDYAGTARRDRLASGQVRVDYGLARNVDLTCKLELSVLHSTVALASYQDVTTTVGATYRY